MLDIKAIAESIGTKTVAQVRTFFVNYRRRYNLDNVLKEYESENQIASDGLSVPPTTNGQSAQQNGEADIMVR